MRYLTACLIIASLNGCALFPTYQPLSVECKADKMKVLEYTRVCERESYLTWQSCSVQAERLFCTHPDWKENK